MLIPIYYILIESFIEFRTRTIILLLIWVYFDYFQGYKKTNRKSEAQMKKRTVPLR